MNASPARPSDDTPSLGHGSRWRLTVGAAVLVFALVFLAAHQITAAGQDPAPGLAWIGPLFVWLAVLPWLAWWWAGAWGWGTELECWLGRAIGNLPMRLAMGGAALMLTTWLVAPLTMHPAAMAALPTFGLALGVWRRRSIWIPALRSDGELRAPQLPSYAAVLAIAGAAPAAMYAVAVTLPAGSLWSTEAFGYDVLSYHLNLPKQWIAAGAMIETEHDVYGYLPSLIEVSFGWFLALRGATPEAVYLAQAFHASWAALAAVIVARFVRQSGRSATSAGIAGAVLLAVPWVLITGTLAYNEAVVLALSAAAASLALERKRISASMSVGVAVGLLVGAATLAKLTAGFMVAVPIGLMLLARANFKAAMFAGLIGTLTLVPYFVRNAAWTGNPVFPFATDLFGMGHWDASLVQRWAEGHKTPNDDDTPGVRLLRQWLLNTGYGAAGGSPTPPETNNVARFPREFGLPMLWIGAVAAVGWIWIRGLALTNRRRVGLWSGRWISAALLAWIAWQVAAWFLLTHQQSRFLVGSVVPGVMLLGLGASRINLSRSSSLMREGLRASVLVVVAVPIGLTSLSLLMTQTLPGQDLKSGQRTPMPVWFLSDALATRDHPMHPAHHPINALPRDAKVMIAADTARLYYLDREVVYASAFDASPLGPVLDQAEGDDDRAAALLRERGVTHLWVGWSELRRLHATYGHDPRVTEAAVAALVRDWPVVENLGGSTLFAVPR